MAKKKRNKTASGPVNATPQAWVQAMQSYQAGRLEQAERSLLQVLQQQPRHVEAFVYLGVIAHQTGKLEQAIAHYQQAIAIAPNYHQAYNNLGATYWKQGDLDRAVATYQQAIALQPDYADAYNNLGTALLHQGKVDEALAAYRQALTLLPDSAEAHNNLGSALKRTGNLAEAIAHFQQAIALKSDYAQPHHNLASVLKQQGRWEEAQTHAQHAIAIQPNYPDAQNNLAAILKAQGKTAEAIAAYQTALLFKPHSLDAHSNLGALLIDTGNAVEGIAHYRQAIAIKPNFPEIHNNLGAALKEQGDLEDAIAHYRQAIAIKPEFAEAHNNLGAALRDLNQLDDALNHYQQALALQPNNAEIYRYLGNVWMDLGKFEEAIAHYQQALALDPNDAMTHSALGTAFLAIGDFQQGFSEYEWRWQTKEFTPRLFSQPQWDGSDLSGKTILLHAEQGFGDTIQFIRYAPLVAQKGGKVIVECYEPLIRLFAPIAGIDRLVPTGMPLPDFDVHAPLMSLPYLLRTTLETVPDRVPYLGSAEESAEFKVLSAELEDRSQKPERISSPASPASPAYSALSTQHSALKIGIAWGANLASPTVGKRACPLRYFLQLLDIGDIELYSLQKGQQVAELEGETRIVDLSPQLHDFADTASAIAQLDLIITVDTAVAHLAGALGKSVWVLLPFSPDWRWMRERTDSPWYPTMRLFRQPQPGDWQSTFEQVQAALNLLVSPPAPPEPASGKVIRLEQKPRKAAVPTQTDDKFLLAQQHHGAGRFYQAEELYRQILAEQPQQPDVLHGLGCLVQQRGQMREAIAYYQQALAVKPDYPETHNNLGVAFWRENDAESAIASYRKAIAFKPDYAEAYNNLGVALWKQNLTAEAIAAYRQAIALKADYVEAYNNLGAALRSSGAVEEAIEIYNQALAINPNYAEVYNNLGIALNDRRNFEAALANFRTAIRLKPDYSEAYSNLGNVLHLSGQLDEAVAILQQAIALKPDYIEAYNRLGNILQKQGRMEEAIATYHKALQIRPDYVKAMNNLAHTLEKAKRVEDAIAHFNRVLEIEPDNAIAHFGRAFTHLLKGDFLTGFTEYEWRWQLDQAVPREFSVPLWDGSPLTGRTILLHAEQGLGDTIQFIRYAPLVKARGAKVIVECQDSLISLFSNIAGIDELVAKGSVLPAFDVHAPLLSLPRILGTTLETIPVDIPYLRSAEESAELKVLSAELEEESPRLNSLTQNSSDSALKIGIVWMGNVAYEYDLARYRSCSVEFFLELADLPNLILFSLQKENLSHFNIPVQQQEKIQDLSSKINDFFDTAAIIEQLDLIITIDTAVAHLAGAMGKQVWVLLPYSPDWRWMLQREDSPWYPTMRLFRQPQPGDWQGMFDQVKTSLCQSLLKTNSEQNIETKTQANDRVQRINDQLAIAIEYHQAGKLEEAAAIYRQILTTQPNCLEARYWLAIICAIAGKLDEAIHYYQLVLAAQPQSAEVHHNLGVALHKQGRRDEAYKSYQAALNLDPNNPEFHNSFSVLLEERGQLDLAIAHLNRAIALNPKNIGAHYNLGNALAERGQLQMAIAQYNRVIAVDPNYTQAYWNRAIAFLLSGNFTQGFVEYEWRWKQRGMEPPYASTPLWDGSVLAGKTILLYAEQGFGDTIQFIRYVPLVKAKCDRLIVQCQPTLIRLFQQITAIDELVAEGDPLPHFDAQAPLMSLPRILKTTLETIPNQIPYLGSAEASAELKVLSAEERKSAELEDRSQKAEVTQNSSDSALSTQHSALKIGIVWECGQKAFQSVQHQRTCPFTYFLGLLDVPGIELYSLQRDVSDSDFLALQARSQVRDLSPQLVDFADTAQVISQLDLIITIDTAVAHLAGAIGKQVWVLLPYSPDWRWMLQREDTPWYPTMRLFRQPFPGDWEGTFEQVKTALHSSFTLSSAPKTQPQEIVIPNSESEALFERGCQAYQQGKLAEAIALLTSAIRQNPNHALAYRYLGLSYKHQGKREEAIAQYRKAIALQPDLVEAYISLGVALRELGRLEEAAATYQQALEIQPNFAIAHNNLGNVCQDRGRWDEAIFNYRQALVIKPDYVEALVNLGAALQEQGKLEEAKQQYHQALALNPNSATAHSNLGVVLHHQGQVEEAIAHYNQAIALEPEKAVGTYNNLGLVLQELGQLEEASNLYRKAISLKPSYADAYHNFGVTLMKLCRLEEAIHHYQQALSFKPNFAEAHVGVAITQLMRGNFLEGFREYEWRWQLKDNPPQNLPQPQWDGSDLNGKTILLHAEQGYGDTVQFIRYAPLVKAKGGRVIVACPPPLLRLLETAEGIDQLFPKDAVLPPFDVHAPLLSLPYILGTTLETVPAKIPYLKSAESKVLSAEERSAELKVLSAELEDRDQKLAFTSSPASPDSALSTQHSALKVGIVWAGSPSNKNDRTRSCKFTDFRALVELDGVEFYSLQKGSEELKNQPEAFSVRDLADELNDFADTARAIAQLDLVITVDTAVAHVAGAIGKPVWVVLCFSPDWRWMLERSDTPWYPTMRLFRQPQPGDWESAFEQVKAALKLWVKPSEPQPHDGEPATHDLLLQAFEHHQAGRLEEAKALYSQILETQPQHVEARQLFGTVNFQLGDAEVAIAHLRHAIALKADYAEAYNNLGAALWKQGESTEALSCYRKAIALNPNYVDAYNNLGTALRHQDLHQEAIAAYQTAIAIKPDCAEAYNNMGLAFRDLLKIDDAIASYQRAIELKPDYPEAHLHLAFSLLLNGDFTRGFAEYEWRWRQKEFSLGVHPQYPDNSDLLAGKTVLLRAEQGFGDTIQFIRYAPLVKAKAGRVIVECQPPLTRLLENTPGIDQIVARGDTLPTFDLQIPLLSLPRLFKTTVETIPATLGSAEESAELKVLSAELEDRNQKLAFTSSPASPASPASPYSALSTQHSALKVGIVWAGSPSNKNDRSRSCEFSYFKSLLDIPGITFYSLQKGPRVADIDAEYPNLISLDEQLNDFADTANAIAQLDLIITVDTAVAHLAGTLGKPVWLLLCFSPDWRWMLEREDSPWYPTMRLFRQSQPGNWQGVFEQVKSALESWTNTPESITNHPIQRTNDQRQRTIQAIGIGWPLSLMTGWGVYGMNLTLQLLRKPGIEPLLLMPASVSANLLNPLHQSLLQPLFQNQQQIQQILNQHTNRQLTFELPVLHALGNHFSTSEVAQRLRGSQTIGMIFFEDTHLTSEALAKAKTYDLIVAGSSWNAKVLKGYGLNQVQTVIQGIDPTIFHPAPKANLFESRFVIFSGGKLEYRKGQDIAIAAFKRFQKRHPEALLLTAWHNFWPQFMVGLEQTGNVTGLPQVNADKRLQITDWLVANDIPASAVIDLGPIPNHLVGQILREADVAVFTNRCEGGTNLAAMESLACGVPTILSANTGHLDLIDESHCYPLLNQRPAKPTAQFIGVEGWGESDVDEVVEALERVYADRKEAKRRGLAAAQFMQDLTWEKQVNRFLDTLNSAF